jgi:hypothetical protein
MRELSRRISWTSNAKSFLIRFFAEAIESKSTSGRREDHFRNITYIRNSFHPNYQEKC